VILHYLMIKLKGLDTCWRRRSLATKVWFPQFYDKKTNGDRYTRRGYIKLDVLCNLSCVRKIRPHLYTHTLVHSSFATMRPITVINLPVILLVLAVGAVALPLPEVSDSVPDHLQPEEGLSLFFYLRLAQFFCLTGR
jgi:hypothetical protein